MNDSFRLCDDGIYRCQAFAQFDWHRHGFGTRHASPTAEVTLRQIHSNVVWNAHGLNDREQEGDALITNEPGLCVGVRTADCVPILLLDTQQRAVAAVHAGWRGSADQIASCAIRKMAADFASDPANIWVAIGPCVCECCYEVSAEVAEHFTQWTHSPAKANGKQNLNLAQANVRQLERAGIPSRQIFDSGLCTFCESDTFYSFRREAQEPGRMLSVICRL